MTTSQTDTIIAEKVMGWKRIYDDPNVAGSYWDEVNHAPRMIYGSAIHVKRQALRIYDRVDDNFVFAPSFNERDAVQVLTALKSKGWTWRIISGEEIEEIEVTLIKGYGIYRGAAKTLPLAVVSAALKVADLEE